MRAVPEQWQVGLLGVGGMSRLRASGRLGEGPGALQHVQPFLPQQPATSHILGALQAALPDLCALQDVESESQPAGMAENHCYICCGEGGALRK